MNPIINGSQPALKFWGDLETDGAVYAVYLKKVRYHHAGFDSSEQVSHLEWETVRIRMIKAGTLFKLIESFTTETGELESTHMNIFLATYRSFASPNQVLTILLNRYKQMYNSDEVNLCPKTKEQIMRTIEKVLLVWLDMYPEDFYEPPQFLSLLYLKEFSEKYVPGSVIELRAKHRLLKYQNNDINPPISTENPLKIRALFKNMSILQVPEKELALQLTYIDSELFKKVMPHQCLGSVWSRRDKICNFSMAPSTVTATINQFNAVSLRVISTILSDLSLKPASRANIVLKWISVAQELRMLKNFSSLKAITAALQSNSVHRLTKVWLAVPKEKLDVFSKLAKIFSEENNQTNCRSLLVKEGSAKFVDTACPDTKLPQNHAYTMQGTIPYLGTFLTDLSMIDVAFPDYLPNGLINFDKRRKEFEILAQIKLLQSSANNYDIQENSYLQEWFDKIQVFDEKESYELSCLIEPPDNLPKKQVFDNVKNSVFKKGHQKCDSFSSTNSSNTFLSDKWAPDSQSSSSLRIGSAKVSKSVSCLSLSNLSLNAQSEGLGASMPDFYVIKVSLKETSCDIKGSNVYKSIVLRNSDHTPTVIKNAMAKHGLEGDPNDFNLVQFTSSGGEIIFPDSTNVYYAVDPSLDLNFTLRPKTRKESTNSKREY